MKQQELKYNAKNETLSQDWSTPSTELDDKTESFISQLISLSISDQMKQQNKQLICQLQKDIHNEVDQYISNILNLLEDYSDQQTLIISKFENLLEQQDNYFHSKFQEDEIYQMQYLQNHYEEECKKCLLRLQEILNVVNLENQGNTLIIQQQDKIIDNKELQIIDCQFSNEVIYEKQQVISLESNTSIQIFEDSVNNKIIALCKKGIITFTSNKYSLFTNPQLLYSQTPSFFSASPNGNHYVWGNKDKFQIYDTKLKLLTQHCALKDIESLVFSIQNELAISTNGKQLQILQKEENKMWKYKTPLYMHDRIQQMIFIENGNQLVCMSKSIVTILIKDQEFWSIFQQLQVGTISIAWSEEYKLLITLNFRQHMEVWKQVKKTKRYNSVYNNYFKESLDTCQGNEMIKVNSNGTLLFQMQSQKIKIYQLKFNGEINMIYQQTILDHNIIMFMDFTNFIAINGNQVEWYQLTDKEDI